MAAAALAVGLLLFVLGTPTAVCPPDIAHLAGVYSSQRPAYFMLPDHGFLRGVEARAFEFENCTGGQIKMRQVTYGEWANELRSDLGFTPNSGARLFDAYMVKSAWFAHYAEIGALEPLKQHIQAAGVTSLEWTDVLALIRDYLVTHNQEVYAMPNDADFVILFARTDLLNRDSKSMPRTWEELIDVATIYNSTDLNDDGTPDYGLCWPLDPAAFAMQMMQVHASVLQSKGVSQGFFFDAVTGQPLFDNAGSEYAFEVVRKLVQLTAFAQQGPNYHYFTGAILDFMAGRCAFLAGAPGLPKYVTLNGGVQRKDENGTVVWAASERPKRIPMVGSTQVYDFVRGRLVSCTEELCPYAAGVPLVNRPPFFGSGGFATAIGAHSPEQLKRMLFDFLAYLNAPAQSLEDVASLGFMDPYRLSHLNSNAISTYLDKGWPREEAEDLLALKHQLLANGGKSGAMDLRIPYRDEYIFEPGLTATRSGNYDDPRGWEYLVYQWLGWERSPQGPFVPIDQRPEPAATLNGRLQQSWIATMRSHGGVLATLEVYRKSLGLPALSVAELCKHHREEYEQRGELCPVAMREDVSGAVMQAVIITVAATAGLGLLLLGCYFARRGYSSYVSGQQAKVRMRLAKQERVKAAMDDLMVLNFPFCVVRYSAFKTLGSLAKMESLRDLGLVLFLDTWEAAMRFAQGHSVMFVSHQWLGWEQPDPDNLHYPAILAAAGRLKDEKGVNLDDLFIWVDYSSIPQDNLACKLGAIKSLVVYAALSQYFVICAPGARHLNTHTPCNLDTYAARGWCRLEQWARLAVGGVSDMYIFNEAGLMPLTSRDGWQSESVDIFHGSFTVDSDRALLIDVVLGLWAYALQHKGDPTRGALYSIVEQNKKKVFPPELFDDLVEYLEEEATSSNMLQSPSIRAMRTVHGSVVPNEENPQHGCIEKGDGAGSKQNSDEEFKQHFEQRVAPGVVPPASVKTSL